MEQHDRARQSGISRRDHRRAIQRLQGSSEGQGKGEITAVGSFARALGAGGQKSAGKSRTCGSATRAARGVSDRRSGGVRLSGAGEITARTRGDGGPIRPPITAPGSAFVNCDSSQSCAGTGREVRPGREAEADRPALFLDVLGPGEGQCRSWRVAKRQLRNRLRSRHHARDEPESAVLVADDNAGGGVFAAIGRCYMVPCILRGPYSLGVTLCRCSFRTANRGPPMVNANTSSTARLWCSNPEIVLFSVSNLSSTRREGHAKHSPIFLKFVYHPLPLLA
jgi:hypothetical protein